MGRLGWCGRQCARGLLAALLAGSALVACGGEPAPAPTIPLVPDAGFYLGGQAARDGSASDAEDLGSAADAFAAEPVHITAKVSGLVGSGLVLRSAAGEDRAVAADGDVDFAEALTAGGELVTIEAQPHGPNQTCRVQAAEAGDVRVVCETDTYFVGGTAIGLQGTGLTLEDAHGQQVALSASGAFHFADPAADLTSYALHIASQPAHPRQTCALQGGEGEVMGADVRSVTVTCSTERFPVSGEVSGLLGSGLVLELAGETIAIGADGPFAFADKPLDGSAFAVEVQTQPHAPDQRCVVVNGAGSLDGAPVSDVKVVCGALGGLRISEVGSCYFSNSACWFELYNAGTATEELSYYQLRAPSSLREAPYTLEGDHAFALPSAALAPGAYLVVQAQSTEALADGQGLVHVADGTTLPWWADQGFLELTTAGQSVDFVRFGANASSPSSAGAWAGMSVLGLPSDADAYGYAIARDVSQTDRDSVADWTVRAFATPGGPNDVTSDADVDLDGVPDSAEVFGGRFAGIDLYAMGARVGPRDVFVEIDRMESSDPGVSPRREALDKVVAAFAKHGIAVHFDVGSLFSAGFDPASYNLGGGDVVAYAEKVGFAPVPQGVADLYDYKAQHMAAARRSLFYYELFASSQDNPDPTQRSVGIGERPGNDTIITLGGIGLGTVTSAAKNMLINYQAATVMHELGHNLGLRHGGGDDVNYKPNYVSVMNYLYSPVGLPTIGWSEGDRYDLYRHCSLLGVFQLTNAPTADPSKFLIDYSDGLSGDLSESNVVESEGLGRTASKSVDYNCNGRTDSPYARDLNGDGEKDVFTDHDDWGSLNLVFRRSYSGDENGPDLWFRAVAQAPHDLLTDDVQDTGDDPCPPFASAQTLFPE